MSGLPVATALIAGLAHALEPDHMAAVTTFVSRRPHPVRAMGFGIRWGMGHSAALLVAGGAVVLLGVELREPLVRALEVAVGAMLVWLGLWSASGTGRPPVPEMADREVRVEAPSRSHRLTGGTAWVGAAHGLAGTAGFLALVPVLLLASPWSAGGYLLVFAAGTVGAMGAYGLLAGLLFQRAGARAPRAARGMRIATGCASIAIGVAWIAGALR